MFSSFLQNPVLFGNLYRVLLAQSGGVVQQAPKLTHVPDVELVVKYKGEERLDGSGSARAYCQAQEKSKPAVVYWLPLSGLSSQLDRDNHG